MKNPSISITCELFRADQLGADAIQSITGGVAASQMTEFLGHRIFQTGSETKMKCGFIRPAARNYFQIILFIRSAN